MRSSVSVILSDPPLETPMSYPDYSSHPSHHQGLLVLVKQVGNQVKSQLFPSLLSRICRVTHVTVNDSSGNARPLWVHYKTEYPVENNDWGDFQAHRRLLGIISIGHVSSQSDLNDVCRQHESLKVKYSMTLFDSRCIILGVNPDGTVYHGDAPHTPSTCGTPELSSNDSNVSQSGTVNDSHHSDSIISGSDLTSTEKCEKSTSSSGVDRDSGVYVSPPLCSDSRNHNGYHVHCSRSSDSGSECPSELGSGLGMDDIEKNNIKNNNCNGDVLNLSRRRNRGSQSSSSTDSSYPSTGKVFLQPPTCFKTRALFYPTEEHAVNIESQIQEFISSLFWVLEYKRMDKSQEKMDKPQLLCAPFERKDIVGLDMDSRTNRKKCLGRYKKHLADLSLQVGLPYDALAQYSQTVEILKSCNDWLWLAACYEGLCSASLIINYPHLIRHNSLQRYSSLGLADIKTESPFNLSSSFPMTSSSRSLPSTLSDPSLPKQHSKYCLSPSELVDKYKETIIHYSKYRNAGVIETEASIKAVHVLIEQKRHLLAAEFLSNVVFINLQLSDEEKIVRFNALSDLYKQIGFHRKASFFRRVAAMRCVAPQNQDLNWSQCYRLLLLSLEGYKLNLDVEKFTKDGRPGWPALQKQILQEVIGTSRRMNEHSLCTRHQAFLLAAMLPFFSGQEKKECFNMLELVSEKSGTNTSPLHVKGSSIIVPAVHFNTVPLCRLVNVMPPSREKQVELRAKLPPIEDSSPFIFSPFQSMAKNNKTPGKLDFQWVEGDICEVSFGFVNPMGFQLKLSSVMLITEGVDFEPWTSTVVLEESHEEIQMVSLRGRPQEPGELRILGYSFSLGGVLSNCRFSSMDQLKIPFFSLDVVPALPCVQIFCDASSSDTGLVSDGGLDEKSKVYLSMNAGETGECSIVIHNVSSQPVEYIEISLESDFDPPDLASQIFQYSIENLHSQLPIPPGGRASLTLYLYAYSDFMMVPGESFLEEESAPSLISGSEVPSFSYGTHSISSSSKQSTLVSSLRGQKARRAKSNASLASSKSSSSVRSESYISALASSSLNVSMPLTSQGLPNRTLLEGSLKISYTGGLGKEAMYWRVSDVNIVIESLPSILLTRWDVLPAESPSQCYIVLDLLNSSGQEMDLQYTSNKRILIQAGESCRVPLPIDRFPLSKLTPENNVGELSGPTEILGAHVASLIDLRWTLAPNDIPGRASFPTISFPPQTHHLITMAPIHWDVKLNDESVECGSENSGTAGLVQEFSIGIRNTSGSALPPLAVIVNAYQDHQNGGQDYRLETKMVAIGSTKFYVPKLNPDDCYYHECGFIFFTAGVYKVEVSGCPVENHSSSYHNFHSSFNTLDHYSSASSGTSYHLWKFSPPIEMNIDNP